MEKKIYIKPVLSDLGQVEEMTQQYGAGWSESLLGSFSGSDISEGSGCLRPWEPGCEQYS